MGRSIRLRHTEGIGRRSPWCVDSFPVRCLASFAGNVKRAMPALSFSLASCPNRTSFLFLEQPENALPLRFRGYGLKQLLIMFDVETMDESLHTNLSCRCRPVETKIRRLTTLAWRAVTGRSKTWRGMPVPAHACSKARAGRDPRRRGKCAASREPLS